ncbi:MAG: T9SS type A sorting domain-containing protein [Candidatus Zixiibacteriota bacterium]|nr:MAG: T9SS type A sorting domain-containing protein [candidate division Zixibacteria bacterium]
MFRVIKSLIILCIGLSLILSLTALAQPEVIGDGWILSPPYDWKKVPIYRYEDIGSYFDTLSVITFEYLYPYDYQANCHVRFPDGWSLYYSVPSPNINGIEFYADTANNHFYYDSFDNVLIFQGFDPYYWIWRNCPGRPVFDQRNNLHMIWEGGTDTLFYGYSTDTLNTIEVIDTLTNMPAFLRLTTSPDNGIVGAVFYDRDADSLYKFLAYTGQHLDFSSQPESYFFDAYDYYDIGAFYDIMLDWQGRICLELNKDYNNPWLCWWGWGCHYFWNEEYGFRFLRESYDDVLDGTMFEICFGTNENEILLIDSGVYYANLRFFYSPNGGNTWYLSGFSLGYVEHGSSRRIYGDTLDFVYSHNDTCYYYAIPRDSILYELTGTSDNIECLPSSISLSNFPNPFNSSTTISFSITEPDVVNLSIYNIQGQCVVDLFHGIQEAGEHAVVWDASDYPSGVYFSRLEAGGSSKTAKMVLLK